jgi:acetolactate synthase-1/2/3 large subunit
MRTLADSGIDTLFTNPGTTELHLVEAAEATSGLRSVLALFEGTVSGAADGFGRIADRPAATLLHLGPGQGNGWANFHNARRARTPIVSVIGDQATFHQRNDPPLMSDIAAVAKALDSRVASPLAPGEVSAAARAAVADACSAPGRISTVVMPADVSWSQTDVMAAPLPSRPAAAVAAQRIREIAEVARAGGNRVAMLLGGQACRADGLLAASRIAAAAGIRVYVDTYTTRLAHGAGLPEFPRLEFYPEPAVRQLDGVTHLITTGTRAPVAFFAYLDEPGLLTPDDAANLSLADVHEDAITALEDLADLVAPNDKPHVNAPSRPELPAGPLMLGTWPQVIGALLPDNAIICDETVSSSQGLLAATAGAPPHDVLSQTGGAMGAGLPMALGAAIAAPDRPVIALVGDGCAMYTISALWSHARENLDITTVILKNSSYGILREEWTLLKEPGQGELHDSPLINLTGAPIDFVGLARSMGVPGSHADTAEEFAAHLRRALNEPGPHLIEIVIPPII